MVSRLEVGLAPASRLGRTPGENLPKPRRHSRASRHEVPSRGCAYNSMQCDLTFGSRLGVTEAGRSFEAKPRVRRRPAIGAPSTDRCAWPLPHRELDACQIAVPFCPEAAASPHRNTETSLIAFLLHRAVSSAASERETDHAEIIL